MKKFQVAVVGINSIFGGTSALLLKQSPFIKCLKLYDQKNAEAAIDLCAINTQCKVKMFLGNEQLEKAFEGADIIVISDEANEAMMSLDSHLMTTAGNYKNYAKAIAQAAPQAIIVVASTPINCLLPIMSQLLVKQGCYNYNKVMGSTLVDTIRASSILASHLNLDPKEVVLPVIGGSSERTRVPVFSQSRPFFSLKKDEKTNLIMNIRRGDVQVLANKGSPEVLNRAYSTVRFLNSIMAGLRGDPNVTDITLCRTDSVPGVDYFSLPVIFGKEGIVKRFGVPKTTEVEDEMVEEAIKNVKKDADKAAYIVRGAIELPEQKYLSSNERASSQKEMFDLYVKCLPKPVDNKQDSMSDYTSKKSTNYSFKNLIKDERSINPSAVPENKSFRRMACNKLKNVASEDSFLKSTGFFTSPLQNPILILEPMVCPSAPHDANKYSELGDSEVGDIEVEEHHILHEQNLAKSGKGDMISMDNSKDTNLCMTPTRKNPLSSNEIAQTKTVDPIAKLKDQVVDRESGKNVDIRPSRVSKFAKPSSRYENQHITKKVPDQDSYQGTARCDAVQQPATRRSREIEEEILEEEILSEKEKFGCTEAEGYSNDQGDPENNSTSFVYDIRSDRALPAYNIYNRKVPASPGTEEEKGECQEIVINDSKYYNPDNDEKYRKLVSRLFKKLDGLNEGVYLPLKSSDRCNSRCRQSFTESAVRSKSHWTSTGQLFHSKPPFKIKLAESPFDAEQDVDNNYCQKNLYFKKARKPAPRIKPFISQSTKNTASCSFSTDQSVSEVQDDEVVENNEEMLHVVCPKCQNKITCSPDKNVNASKVRSLEEKLHKRSTEKVAGTQRDPEMKKIHISYYGPRPDCCRTHDSEGKESDTIDTPPLPVLNTPTTPSKTLRDTELQEERLRKLKEKINQKLIPLLNGNCNNHSSSDSPTNFVDSGSKLVSSSSCLESYDPSPCEHRSSKDNKSLVGTPFVVGKEASQKENSCETKNLGRTRNSETKWQGIPFVVKGGNEKAERRHKEELSRPEDLKGNEETRICPKGTDEQVSSECSYKSKAANKRSAKTANKLQLLGSSSEHKAKPEIEEKIAELIESEKIIKDNKETRFKREILDLKSEDVRSYMQARVKDNFERSQQHKMTADTSNEEKDKDTNNAECDEKSETSPESANKQIKGQLIDSSATEILTKSQSSNQTNHSVTEVGLKFVSSADSKNSHASESKRVESKTDSNVTSSSVEPVEKSGGDRSARLREASENSGAEKQKCVGISPPIDTSNLNAESAKLEHQRVENNSEQTLNKNNDMIDKNVDTTDHSGSKIMQKNSLVTSKSDCRSKPNSILELIVGKPKSANKLQLLAKARELQLNNHDKCCSINSKLQNIWEQTLNGKTTSTWSNEKKSCSRKYRDISDGIMGKKSAAVKIALGNNVSKPPTFKVKLKAPTNNTNILEGLMFPCSKTRRKPTHNLLKELASSAAQRESRRAAEMIPKKPVRRGRSLDPLNQIHLCKEVVKQGTSLSENLKEDMYFGSRSAEYSRDEEKFAKLASELMMKRKLTRPQTVASKWKLDGFEDKSRTKIQKLKRPSSCSSVRNLRNQWTDYGIGKDSERESRIRKSADDVLSKLISMPQVRHQMEHVELPLGPLEVQPGLAPLNYAAIGSKFPSADNSWESVLFNEYIRSNLLPSLKDTRETFHLEERPS